MPRKRVTKQEKMQRQQWTVAQIEKGVGFSELTSLRLLGKGSKPRTICVST